MPVPSSPLVSRRQFLIGGSLTAGAVLLGACGSDDASTTSSTSATGAGDDSLALAQFFGGSMFVAGRELRAPFGVIDRDGLVKVDDTPAALTVQVLNPDGSPHGDEIEVERRSDGLPRAYFPLVTTVDEPGSYTVRTEIDGSAAEMSFLVSSADEVKVIQVGAEMPALATPTIADARGVTPVCTREPVCPLHAISVAEALTAREPFALLVASPAFCQISICGPVLDVLLDVRDQHPDMRMLHAEVFSDPANDQRTYAPVVGDLGLHFEPCLVLVGADGKVADRIDVIYDRTEASERLALLV